ncbi:MAG: hypothetical protein WC242_00535 [Candidatus Paceibacterota bacterium]|jgi:hypothetical protein
MATESRIVRLFRQRELLKRELERTERALRPLNSRAHGLRQKIQLVSRVDEVWDGIPVYLDIDKRNYGGYISLVDNDGFINTVRWVHIHYTSNGRGRLGTYEITIYGKARYVAKWNKYYPLRGKRISEVQAIVREWITKGTIDGKDPRVE